MRHLIGLALIAIAGVVVSVAIISAAWVERDRVRYEGQAIVIRADADARFRDAQSTAVIVSSLFPLVALVAGTIIVSAIAFNFQRGGRNEKIIERQIIILPPGTPRRELWRLMSQGQQFRLLESQDEKERVPAYDQIDDR